MIFVNVLLELEVGRVLLQYMEKPDVVKVIPLSKPRVEIIQPTVSSAGRLSPPRAVANAPKQPAHPAHGVRQQRMWRPATGWSARAPRMPSSLPASGIHACALMRQSLG